MRSFVALAIIFVLAGALGAQAEDRPLRGVALVIGQSDYTSPALPKLTNPRNDARAIDDLLDELGFDVDRKLNATDAELQAALTDFVAKAKGADVALIYYSGHGIEAGGEDYLVPTDADLSDPQRAGETLIPISALLDELAKTVPVTVMLLDACRTGGLPDGTMIQPAGASAPVVATEHGLAVARGMMPVGGDATPGDSLGMVVGFAAAPGQPAYDGDPGQANSPYAAALLKQLGAGGYSFGDVMTMVSEEVYLKTGARQLPWVNSSLRRVLTFGQIADTDPDGTAITNGRRKLLLSIAAQPVDVRQEVEAAAKQASVPMDAVYGLLQLKGQDLPKDPAELDKLIKTQTEQVRKALAEHQALTSSDTEIVRLSDLAQKALNEGLLDLTLQYRQAAEARWNAISGVAIGTAINAKTRVLEGVATIAGTAEALNLKGEYLAAAAKYAEAFEQVRDIDQATARSYKAKQAEALLVQGTQKGDNDALEAAIADYRSAASLTPRESDIDDWASLQNSLANALQTLGERQSDAANLEAAVAAYRAVLDVKSRSDAPLDWATTQTNLGIALQSLGSRERDTASLEASVSAFRSALEERTRERAPFEWAQTQNSLGTALETLGKRETGTKSLEAAVAAFRLALEEESLKETPLDWAQAQNNLGATLELLGDREGDTAMLQSAASAYRAALLVDTRDRLPLAWAGVEEGLGNTLESLGERETGTANLEAAIAAYRSALEEDTRDRVPLLWAGLQYNLGFTLKTMGGRETGMASLEAAVAAFRLALEERTRQSVPLDWASTQASLGVTLFVLGNRETGTSSLEAAVVAFRSALDEWTRDRAPVAWAGLQNNIGNTLVAMAGRQSGTTSLKEAVLAYDAALQERTRDNALQAWAGTLDARGWAQAMLGQRTADPSLVRQGRADIQAVWAEYRRQGSKFDQYFEDRLAKVDAMAAGL